ncbi:MAG: VacB/RNase II family 3'-5' exoribonuclease [Eubacteriales bacterium]|nr:VacB/RNase II family 3'-5' exoribonuclease [Eubacteriales bacterium]
MSRSEHSRDQSSVEESYSKILSPVELPPGTESSESLRRVGILEAKGRRDGLVRLDRNHPLHGREVYIPKSGLHGAPFGMKVLVQITAPQENPVRGEILEVLGDPERSDTAMLGIIHDYGLQPSYPEAVLAELESWPSEVDPAEIEAELAAGRHDLRELFTLTIDGIDAKDLDDALSIRKEAENYRLWVHIADVSHYVHFGSKLDAEALQRGNSVYLADRVLPMLPPKLSNQLCSLNPEVDRLTFTVEMLFDRQGKRLESKLYPAVINSNYRGNYSEIFDSSYPEALREPIQTMLELSELLAAQREERGALVFDFPETVVDLDIEGHPLRIHGAKSNFAHGLIESFMIAANEAVADFAKAHKLPVVYRVHDNPDPEKIEQFKRLLLAQKLKAPLPKKFDPKSLQLMLAALADYPQSETLSFMLLRSLAKAEYSTHNLGHFGLASESYLHFTAPIRRYADLHTHRVLKRYLSKRSDKSSDLRPLAGTIAKHVSDTERISVSAERASTDQKICEYYVDKLGEIYTAEVSGLSPIAFYARMENTAEGTIMYSEMPGYYSYDELLFQARNNSGQALRLGDKLRMQLSRVDLQRRFLDFVPIEFLSGDLAGKDFSAKGRRNSRQARVKAQRGSRAKGKAPAKARAAAKFRGAKAETAAKGRRAANKKQKRKAKGRKRAKRSGVQKYKV